MNILETQYNIKHKAYEIYLSGCKGKHLDDSNQLKHCNGCHNKFSWNFASGSDWVAHYNDQIVPSLQLYDKLVENVWVLGGEPLDQSPRELYTLLNNIKQNLPNAKLFIWTGYDIEWVSKNYNEVFKFIDFIKVGNYDEDNKNTTYIERFDLTLQSEQLLFEVLNDSMVVEV